MPSTVSEIAALSRSVADRTDDTFDIVLSETKCRFHGLAFRNGRYARQLARGLVHGLDAVRNAKQDRAHDPVEPADCVFKRLAPFLDAFGVRHVGAQPVALLQRTLQHDDGARDVSDLIGPLGAGHFRLPVAARDTSHRLGDLHQGPGDALGQEEHDAGEDHKRRDGRHDQPEGKRTAFHFADAHQLVAQGVKLADRGECTYPPLLEYRLAARPEAAVGAVQQRCVGLGRNLHRVAFKSRDRDRRSVVHDGEPGSLEAGELLENGLARPQRAVGNKRREDVAEVVEDRLRHDESQRRFSLCAKSRRTVCVERQGTAHDARPLAVVVGDDRPDILGDRIIL